MAPRPALLDRDRAGLERKEPIAGVLALIALLLLAAELVLRSPFALDVDANPAASSRCARVDSPWRAGR